MPRQTLFFLLTITLIAACNAKQPKEKAKIDAVIEKTGDAAIDELMKQELANQERAISGNKNPVIEIISDPQKVEQLRADIAAKIKKRQEAEAKELSKSKTLYQQYKENDKTVVPEILSILKGSNKQQKSELLDGLAKDYDDRDGYTITEPALREQIFKLLQNPADEKEAVQMIGITQLQGFEQEFEARLLSGKSADEGRIFYWLSGQGKSQRALDYIGKKITSRQLTKKEDLDQVINGMENFGKKANADSRKKIGELALFIYDNKLITPDRIEDLKNSAFTSDAAESLLTCLFAYGDKRVIPIANDILKRKIRTEGPVRALLRLEGRTHMQRVYLYLESEDDFYTGLNLVETVDRGFVDDHLLKKVLREFAKQRDIQDHAVDRIVRTFIDLKAEQYLLSPEKIISNSELAARITKSYQLSKVSFDSVLDDLLSLQLISKRPDRSVIDKIASSSAGEPKSFLLGILDHENVYIAFDAETGFVPVDFDKKLDEFAGKSKGHLKNMLAWMDATEKNDSYSYTVTVVFNGKAFIAKPEDMGDWYDIMTINAILDKTLGTLTTKERFVPVSTGDQTVQYIFGDPEKVAELVKKYKL